MTRSADPKDPYLRLIACVRRSAVLRALVPVVVLVGANVAVGTVVFLLARDDLFAVMGLAVPITTAACILFFTRPRADKDTIRDRHDDAPTDIPRGRVAEQPLGTEDARRDTPDTNGELRQL